jgi:hypothetical protein
MSTEVLLNNEFAAANRVIRTQQKIAKVSSTLALLKQKQARVVEEHNRYRIDLFLDQMRNRHKTWCTECKSLIDEKEAKLFFIEGAKVESGGYGNDSWGCVRFAALHRLCPICALEAEDKHGSTGKIDPTNKIQAHYLAFKVTQEGDEFYARKFGTHVKVDPKHVLPVDPPPALIDTMEKEWKLPAKIELPR